MRPSYHAQRNERCAYVLPESETPFGLTLGNFKTYASCTPKGGVRGLWDADSDRIIFGTHQIAYRLRDRERTIFPHRIERQFTFLPYAQISQFSLDERLSVTECFYVPHGPAHERAVAFVVDIALENASAETVRATVFPWALLVGQRFYGEPEPEVHAAVDGARIRAWSEETGAGRYWGGSRPPDAAVVAVREQVLLKAMRDGALRDEGHLDNITPELAEYARGRIFGAFEYRIDVAPGARETLRPRGRVRRQRERCGARCVRTIARRCGRTGSDGNLFRAGPGGRALHGALTRREPRRRLGQSEYAAHHQRISAGLGRDEFVPPSDILVSRDTSWFVHGFDYFLPQFSRAAIELFNRFAEDSWSDRRIRARRRRLPHVVRSEHQRRYAVAPRRDPASL